MSLTLLDWRRRVAAMYAEVRASADPASAHETWRQRRDRLFAEHPDTPLLPEDRASFTGLDVAPYDPAYRFEVPVDTDVEPQHLEVPTATDGVVPFERKGVVRLGDLGSLDVWWLDSYGGGVFLPVKDALAGRETYGGGRYLLDTVKGADLGSTEDGNLVVDLNFAYNPSCAYDPAWVCPLAQPGNTLAVPLPVGERVPAGH
ncbi:MAG: uncharacterized protein QOJ60_1293 [Actinomycetota bacterium]|jgi:uncharacterized protein (DUF1684 family)|nr:uncharacterized protein [Actinomycetota bacterium]